LELPLVYHQATPLLTRALTLGLTHGLAIYDSLYIVLAQDLNCPLITVDQRQTQAALASGVSLKPITDFSSA
jgi:predicted nucleic acid-binding protein